MCKWCGMVVNGRADFCKGMELLCGCAGSVITSGSLAVEPVGRLKSLEMLLHD